ncbi:MAG TPA: GIY-YIG nuclease family protein [Patescibacteria group bacterium]|nr:GIY-YIG nuclease family protein [Patescibacteria group bacterium]
MEKEQRKAAAIAYKLVRPAMGVYQIRNEVNGRIMVGSSSNLTAIWNRERSMLRFRSHTCRQMQLDWLEHGENNFSFTVLEYLKTDEKIPLAASEARQRLKSMEETWLDKLQPYGETGYNRRLTLRGKENKTGGEWS